MIERKWQELMDWNIRTKYEVDKQTEYESNQLILQEFQTWIQTKTIDFFLAYPRRHRLFRYVLRKYEEQFNYQPVSFSIQHAGILDDMKWIFFLYLVRIGYIKKGNKIKKKTP